VTSSDDQPTTAMPVAAPGRVLAARYELVSVLGSGGMATVFLARDRVLDRDVAVKVLRDQFATDPVFLARFTREALAAGRLSHPGLVPIFDAGVDDGTAFIVMEAVHGPTLHEVLRNDGPFAIERAVRVAADVCAVLDVAHRAGVVHRDIKPGNILLSDDGRTRVLDFGIARSTGTAALTEIATVIGTAAYASPEQAAGEPSGPQSDLYSLGCVLDEMLTGAAPFDAETPVALLHRHVHDEPIPPSALRPDVSEQLDAVVMRLLAKDPGARPATAADARQELLATLAPVAGSTLILPSATLVLPVVSDVDGVDGASRRRAGIAVAAVAAFVVVIATMLALLLGRDGGARATPAVTPSVSSETAVPSTSATSSSPSAARAAPIAVPIATTPGAALDAVRQVIATGRSTGVIDAAAAAQLLRVTDEAATAVDKKKGKSAVPRIQDLADLVDSLGAGGQVAPTAATALHGAIDQLLGLVGRGG